jgi:hypothetical protein
VCYYTWEWTVEELKSSGVDSHIIEDIPGHGQDWYVCCEL